MTAVDERPASDAGRQPLRRPARASGARTPGCSPATARTSTTSSCPGMLHVAFVRSDVACGTITALDVARGPRAARRGRRVHRRRPQRRRRTRRGSTSRAATAAGRSACLADGDVRFVGEPVALVVAESRYIAEDACDLVEVDIDPIDAIVGHDAALARRRPPGPPRARRQRRRRHPGRRRSRARRDLRRRPPTSSPRRSTSTATCACRWSAAASCRSGTASATSSSCTPRPRAPTASAASCRARLGLPENRVRVVMRRRRRRLRAEDVHAPRGARRRARRQAPRPAGEVDRGPPREPHRRPARPRRPHDGELRARRRRPHPRRPRRASRTSARSRPPGSSAIGFVGMLFTGPVQDPHGSGSRRTAVYTNTCGRCSYRGPWMMETVGREQMMDTVARQLGIDPLELRRRNVVARRRPAVHDGRRAWCYDRGVDRGARSSRPSR